MHPQPNNQPERESADTGDLSPTFPNGPVSRERIALFCDLLVQLLRLQHDIRMQMPALVEISSNNNAGPREPFEAVVEKAEKLIERAIQGIRAQDAGDCFQESKTLVEALVYFIRESFSVATQSVLNDPDLLSRSTALADQAKAELLHAYGGLCAQALTRFVEASGYYSRKRGDILSSSSEEQVLKALNGDPSKLPPDSLSIRRHATAIGCACSRQMFIETVVFFEVRCALDPLFPQDNIKVLKELVEQEGWEPERKALSALIDENERVLSNHVPTYLRNSVKNKRVDLSFAESLSINNLLMAPALREAFPEEAILNVVNIIRQGCIQLGERGPLSEATFVPPTSIERSMGTPYDLPMALASEIGPEALAIVSRLRQDPDFAVAVAPYWWCLDVLQDLILSYTRASETLVEPQVVAAADRAFIATLMGPLPSTDPLAGSVWPTDGAAPIKNSSVPLALNPTMWAFSIETAVRPLDSTLQDVRREFANAVLTHQEEIPPEISKWFSHLAESHRHGLYGILRDKSGTLQDFPARARAEAFHRGLNLSLRFLPGELGLSVALHTRFHLLISQFPDYVDDALVFLEDIGTRVPIIGPLLDDVVDEALAAIQLLVRDAYQDKRSLLDPHSWRDTTQQFSKAYRMLLFLERSIHIGSHDPMLLWSLYIHHTTLNWHTMFVAFSRLEFGKVDLFDPEIPPFEHRVPRSYLKVRESFEASYPEAICMLPHRDLLNFFSLSELVVGSEGTARQAEDIGLALYLLLVGDPMTSVSTFKLPRRFRDAVLADTAATAAQHNDHSPLAQHYNYARWDNRLPFSSLAKLFILSATTFQDGNSSDAPFIHMFSGASEMSGDWQDASRRIPQLMENPLAREKVSGLQTDIFCHVAQVPRGFEPADPLDLMLFARAVNLDTVSSAVQRPLLRTLMQFDQDSVEGAIAPLSVFWQPSTIRVPRAAPLSEAVTSSAISETCMKRLEELELFNNIARKEQFGSGLSEKESLFRQNSMFALFQEASQDLLYKNKIHSFSTHDESVDFGDPIRKARPDGDPKPVNRLEFLRLTELLCDLCNGGKSNNVTCVQNPEFLAQIQHLLELDSLIKAVEEEFKRHELKSGSSSLEVAFRPTRGILSEFVGDICDTCISRVPRLAATHPDLTFVPFVKNPSFTGKNGQVPRLAGGSLVLNTEVRSSDGTTERALMIRGFNPAPSLFKSIRAQEIFEAFADYLVPIAQALGAKKIVAPQEVGWGLALTNRPYVFLHVRNQYYSDRASERLQLARPEEAMVNNILVKSVVTIRAVPQTQSEKRNS